MYIFKSNIFQTFNKREQFHEEHQEFGIAIVLGFGKKTLPISFIRRHIVEIAV